MCSRATPKAVATMPSTRSGTLIRYILMFLVACQQLWACTLSDQVAADLLGMLVDWDRYKFQMYALALQAYLSVVLLAAQHHDWHDAQAHMHDLQSPFVPKAWHASHLAAESKLCARLQDKEFLVDLLHNPGMLHSVDPANERAYERYTRTGASANPRDNQHSGGEGEK